MPYLQENLVLPCHYKAPSYLFFGKFRTMAPPAQPTFEMGRVYRTHELRAWGENPPRLAKRLVREGKLVRLGHGIFYAPRRSRFGEVPPTDEALMQGFLEGSSFVFTGPERWNALGLGTTAVFAKALVYNTKRSGDFTFSGRQFRLRRVAFPESPPPEWYVVDLFENAPQAATSPEDLSRALEGALRKGRFDRQQLLVMSTRYGSRRTQHLIGAALS